MSTLEGPSPQGAQLTPKDYYQRYGFDPKKYPLVCKEYSEKRRKLAIDKGLGATKAEGREASIKTGRKDFKNLAWQNGIRRK